MRWLERRHCIALSEIKALNNCKVLKLLALRVLKEVFLKIPLRLGNKGIVTNRE